MPYNLLLLPLAGGYFILLRFVYYKFKYQRLNSQRILFSSIVTGIFLLISCFILRAFLEYFFPYLIPFWYKFLNCYIHISELPYFWTAFFAFFFAVICTEIFNLILFKFNFFNRESALSRAVRKHGDEIEQLFRTSVIKGELMQISLKNGKIYIGFADVIPVPQETNYMKIMPILSGYRDSDNFKVTYTTQYMPVYEEYLKSSPNPKLDLDFTLIIKQDEILSAGLFDMEVSGLFNTKNSTI